MFVANRFSLHPTRLCATIVAVFVNFEFVDFVALAAGIDVVAVHTQLVGFVPVDAEIVVAVDDACKSEIIWSFLAPDKESNIYATEYKIVKCQNKF